VYNGISKNWALHIKDFWLGLGGGVSWGDFLGWVMGLVGVSGRDFIIG
jgi:hypothetical protein